MSVNKVKDFTIDTSVDKGSGAIEIDIVEEYSPVLIDTYWCDRVVIWWNCDSSDDIRKYSVCMYSVEEYNKTEENSNLMKKYVEPNVMEAIRYVFDKLT